MGLDAGEQFIWDSIMPVDDQLHELVIGHPVTSETVQTMWKMTENRGTIPQRLQLVRQAVEKSAQFGQGAVATLRRALYPVCRGMDPDGKCKGNGFRMPPNEDRIVCAECWRHYLTTAPQFPERAT